ncbi:MAG: sugar ABC transporter substrate-binding protein [Candidatus Latescibacteria bacterium]|nr:sugar ABC transporter substrate-binding protein [Candidatus Latescibacterota bacterium]
MRLLSTISITAIVICAALGARAIRWYPTEDVLTVWLYGPPQEAQLYYQLLADYQQQHPQTRLRVENIPARSVAQKLLTGMDAGHAPDLCTLHWTQLPQVASTGQLLALDGLVQRDGIDVEDCYPVGLQAYTYHGTLYGLPLRGSTITCFYNVDLFDRYGVPYPTADWTWEELLEKARQLTIDVDQDGLPDIYGCSPYDIANYVWSAGGEFLRRESGRYVSNLDDPRVFAAVEFYVGLFYRFKVSPPRPGVRTDAPMSTFTFEAGRIAIDIAGPWRIPDYQLLDRFRWNTALFPRGPAGRKTRYAGDGFCIWKGTKQPEEAWDVLKYLVSPQSATKVARLGSDMPPQRSVAHRAFVRPETPWAEEVFVHSMDYDIRLFPQEVWWQDLYRKMLDELDAALAGRTTVAEALAQAHQLTTAYLDRLYAQEDN